MEFVKNIVTDSNTIDILLDYLPDRVFIYNKTNKTIYEKINDSLCPLGSEESYNKGKNALHFEGELSKTGWTADFNIADGVATNKGEGIWVDVPLAETERTSDNNRSETTFQFMVKNILKTKELWKQSEE